MRQKFSIANFVLAAAVARRRARRAAGARGRRRAQGPGPRPLHGAEGRHPLGNLREVPQGSLALAGDLADEPRADQEPAPDLSGRRDRSRPAATGSGAFRSSVRRPGCRRRCARRRWTPRRFRRFPPATSSPTSRGRSSPGPKASTARRRSSPAATPRVVRGEGDIVYVVGIDPKARRPVEHLPARPRLSRRADGSEVLGVEQRYPRHRQGRALRRRLDGAHRRRRRRRSSIGDRLIPAPRGQLMSYAPHAPDAPDRGPDHRARTATRSKPGAAGS